MRLLFLLLMTMAAMAEEAFPLGHPDFYPSPQRPLGWRGDGTGAWPGATGVSAWNPETGENIVWKTPLPGAGMAQPLVIGEKIITTADPNLLICMNIHDGRILWQTAIDHTTVMPPEQAAQAREEIAFFAATWREYSQWRHDLDALEADLAAAKLERPPWWKAISQTKVLVEFPDDPAFQAVMAHAELGPRWSRLFKTQNDQGFRVLTGNNSPLIDPASVLAKRHVAACNAYDIWFADNWEGYSTWSFATPCTDGELIYVTTVNNAVAAVDLAGKIRWLVWEHLDVGNKGPLHTRFIASPLLADGKLVVNQNSHLRVYDARDGRKIWSLVNAYAKKDKNGKPRSGEPPGCRPTPEACSPCLLRIPLPSGGSMAAIADGGSLLLRLEDGHRLSDKMPWMQKGATPIGHGPLYLWTTGADKGVEVSGGIVKVTATDRDTVVAEPVWICKHSEFKERLACDITAILHEERWFPFFGSRDAGACSLSLAGDDRKTYSARVSQHSCSPIIAGQRLYNFPQGSHWDKWTGKILGTMKANIVDLVTGKRSDLATAFIDRRIFEDAEFGLRNRFVGCGSQITNASPSAQANRIFHRTKGYLWCIGDPSQAFPVPKGCPPAGRVAP